MVRARIVASVLAVGALGVPAALATGPATRAGSGAELPTRAQLAIVVLPKDAYGPEASGLEVEIGSGYTGNAAAADATLDPRDTAAQLARAGRIVGYDLSYSDLSGAPLVRRSGLLYVDSSLDLFRSAREADAFVTKQLRDVERLRGKRVELGARLVASSTFPAGGIGERSVGLRTVVTVGDLRFYDTVVGFRIGALVAGVGVERADPIAATAQALRLARSLAARVRLAVDGRLTEQPMRVPPVGRKGVRPVGGPDLAPMALKSGDLAKGAKLVRQGYVDDDSTIGSYEREFDTSPTRSPANVVESDVSLLRHAKEATGFMLAVRAIYTSPQIEQDLAEEWKEPAVRVEGHPSLAAGDESVALVVRAPGADKTPVRVAIVHLRVGRVLGTLVVAGPASSLRFAHVRPLAHVFAERIRAGLQSGTVAQIQRIY